MKIISTNSPGEGYSAKDTVELLRMELSQAVKKVAADDLRQWGKRSATLLTDSFKNRIKNIVQLTISSVGYLAGESSLATRAFFRREGRQYTADRLTDAKKTFEGFADGSKLGCRNFAKALKEDPQNGALELVSVVAGFYVGSGGDGDGGVPDLDLLGGIGAHRSIFTHSIIAGLFVETVVLSLQDLTSVIYEFLPQPHHQLWDSLYQSQLVASDRFVTGASIGIATHLGIDATFDGFTPYKDLPINLPAELHEVLLGLNAATEGAYGIKRASESVFILKPGSRVSDSEEHNGTERRTIHERKNDEDNELNTTREPSEDISPLGIEWIDHASEKGKIAINDLGLDQEILSESVDACKKKVESALEPFRLGVIGEFRAGKSTLINALLGREAAFVDIIEATPAECVFRYGETEAATIKYRDGSEQHLTFEKVNTELADRREDLDWVESIACVEYRLPAERLKNFDLWDAPGLGGSETNQQIAERFLDRLGSAIWVFDATLLGKATMAEPLHRLIRDGKPVHAAVNRVDEFSDSLDDAEQLLRRVYPDTFESITALSALEAFEKSQSKGTDEHLEALWNRVTESVGMSAGEGRSDRIARAIGVAKEDLGSTFTTLRLQAQDKLGLIEHAKSNLRGALEKTISHLEETLHEEVDHTFLTIESDLSQKFLDSEISKDLSDDSVGQSIVEYFNSPSTQATITEGILKRVYERLTHYWSRYSDQAIDLSIASIPQVLVQSELIESVPSSGNSAPHSSDPTPEVSSIRETIKSILPNSGLSDNAIDEGVYFGGLTAVVGAAVAATSAVTWPVILAAVPIGSIVAWKKSLEEQKNRRTPYEIFKGSIANVKSKFIEESIPSMRSDIGEYLSAITEKMLQQLCVEQFGSAEFNKAEEAFIQISNIERALAGSDAQTSQYAGGDVLAILRNPGDRLDLVITQLRFNLSAILQVLPPETSVRVITTCNGPLNDSIKQSVIEAFGEWQGKYKVVCVQTPKKSAISELEPLVLTPDLALVPEETKYEVISESMLFHQHPNGRLAAQKYFAQLWNEELTTHGEIVITHVF